MKQKPVRRRLDLLLVERGLADSPKRAAAMILSGEVRVDGIRMEKAGASVAEDANITVADRTQKYVSRGGFKLEGALQDLAMKTVRLVCLDIGSAHGGFTDCLLQHGAARVYAIDVNVDQLDWKLHQDPRVICVKRNARELRSADLPELADLVAIDVSFISVGRVLGPAVKVAKPGAHFLILIKPQFELPREEISRGGVVTDEKLHQKAIEAVRKCAELIGLECLATCPSRLPGAEGNLEYFLHARKKAME